MVLIVIEICRFLLWDFVTQSFDIDILFGIVLFSTHFHSIFQNTKPNLETNVEPSQTSKRLIVRIFSTRAENFNLVKRVEKEMILYGVFHFGLNIFQLRLNFLGCSLYQFQKKPSGIFRKILRKAPMSTKSLFYIKLQASGLLKV